MSNVSQFIQNLIKHSDQIKKCTRPLRHFGISCFYYFSIKNNGDHFLVTDSPNMDEYYYSEKLYLRDPYLRHPANYRSGFCFFNTNRKEEYDESLAFVARHFHVHPLLGLCEKHKDSVEFFGFWGEKEASQNFEYFYLNHAHLLKSFTSYFRRECSKLLQDKDATSLSLRELLGPDFFDMKLPSAPEVDSQFLRSYLKELGLGAEIAQADALSSRERQCLHLLLHGKSAKETASFLNLSHRTIESYFENIKNKLRCKNKYELFSIAERFFELGLL